MAHNYTVATAIKDAGSKTGISAATITSILAEASAAQTHANQHMKSEDFWTTAREVGKNQVESIIGVDDHMKNAYKKRAQHSMFDSPVSSVEATTAALNCKLGVLALTALLGNSEDDGIDIYSRTAILTLGKTQQFTRSNPSKNASDLASMDKGDAEYAVVCLRKKNGVLLIASAYPVARSEANKNTQTGNDWYQSQKLKTVIKALPSEKVTIVNW